MPGFQGREGGFGSGGFQGGSGFRRSAGQPWTLECPDCGWTFEIISGVEPGTQGPATDIPTQSHDRLDADSHPIQNQACEGVGKMAESLGPAAGSVDRWGRRPGDWI